MARADATAHPCNTVAAERKRRQQWAVSSVDNAVRELAKLLAKTRAKLEAYNEAFLGMFEHSELADRVLAVLPALGSMLQ